MECFLPICNETFSFCNKVRATGNDCCCDLHEYGIVLTVMNSSHSFSLTRAADACKRKELQSNLDYPDLLLWSHLS